MRFPLWHHRNVEILQNKMTTWLYSPRQYGPLVDLQKRLERQALSREWELIKREIDETFKELDEEHLKLSKRDIKSS